MSSNWRRFEILLPLQFNDGRDVPAEWLAESVLEIVDHFGANSYRTWNIEELRSHLGNNLVRIVIDVSVSAKIISGCYHSTHNGKCAWNTSSYGWSTAPMKLSANY